MNEFSFPFIWNKYLYNVRIQLKTKECDIWKVASVNILMKENGYTQSCLHFKRVCKMFLPVITSFLAIMKYLSEKEKNPMQSHFFK